MTVDVWIAAALTGVTIVMAYLGVHLTLHPAESDRARFWYKAGFIMSGVIAVGLVAVQAVRNANAQSEIQRILAQIRQNTEQPPRVTVNVPPAQVVFNPSTSEHKRVTKTQQRGTESAADKIVQALIDKVSTIADRGFVIQESWIRDNNTESLKAGYAAWVEESAKLLESTPGLGSSYSRQFRNARGNAMMGCIEAHSVQGCGYWQDINGKQQTLNAFIGELRQRER